MRVAALYDIHGNLPAFEAVLADARAAGVDGIVIGGDIFPGPMARDVFRQVRALDLPVHYVRGNGERNLVDVSHGRDSAGLPPAFVPLFEWHAAQLDGSELEAISTWPLTQTLSIGKLDDPRDVLFCHATPRDDNEMFNASTPAERIAVAFDGVGQSLVVCGHTHRQFDRAIAGVRVVNAGSVGMPFGGTDAEWLLLDGGVELRRTPTIASTPLGASWRPSIRARTSSFRSCRPLRNDCEHPGHARPHVSTPVDRRAPRSRGRCDWAHRASCRRRAAAARRIGARADSPADRGAAP